MCGGEIFAVCDRLTDAAKGVRGTTFDDAVDFIATGAVGHDSGEYAAVKGVGDGMHAEELREGHSGLEEAPSL